WEIRVEVREPQCPFNQTRAGEVRLGLPHIDVNPFLQSCNDFRALHHLWIWIRQSSIDDPFRYVMIFSIFRLPAEVCDEIPCSCGIATVSPNGVCHTARENRVLLSRVQSESFFSDNLRRCWI